MRNSDLIEFWLRSFLLRCQCDNSDEVKKAGCVFESNLFTFFLLLVIPVGPCALILLATFWTLSCQLNKTWGSTNQPRPDNYSPTVAPSLITDTEPLCLSALYVIVWLPNSSCFLSLSHFRFLPSGKRFWVPSVVRIAVLLCALHSATG